MKNFENPSAETFAKMPDLGVHAERAEEAEEIMERQILELAPDLVDIAQRAMAERPDIIVCTDKSARIFGVPLCRFISNVLQADKDREEEYNPHLTFLNPSLLRDNIIAEDRGGNAVVDIEPNMKDGILKGLSGLRGCKFFVIDETLSAGRSLRSILEAIKLFNDAQKKKENEIDVHFFSLSKDPDPSDGGRITLPKNHQQFLEETLAMAGATEHFQHTLYGHQEHFLFSKLPPFRYVLDYSSRTKPVGKLKSTFTKLKEAPIFETLPEDTREEFLRREQAAGDEIPKILERVARAREKIYASMVGCYNEKTK